jgi:hypothetical protein
MGDEGIRHSLETEHRDEQDETYRRLLKDKVIWLAKDMPVEYDDKERLPWEAEYYELQLIGAEEHPNKYYDPEPHKNGRGEDVDGDSIIFEKNWHLKFAVAKGEKAGDWLFVNFVSKYWRIKKDGSIVGKLPRIAMALDPTLTVERLKTEGIDIEAQVGQFCRASIEPTADGKYGNVTAWAKSKLTDTEKATVMLGSPDTAARLDGEEIPF